MAEPQEKKRQIEGDDVDFSQITDLKVINELPTQKMISLLGTFKDKPVILLFKIFNDIYHEYTATVEDQFAVTAIWPAEPHHIKKYTRQQVRTYRETPEIYQNVTLPMINAEPPEKLQWIANILEGKAEQESVLYRDEDPETGFLISKNWIRWNEQDNNLLYLNVMFRKRISNLRELTKDDIPMLEKVRKKIYELVQEKYNTDVFQIFFHYLPTYYHLHLHITGYGVEDMKKSLCGTSILLDDFIENVTLLEDYYKKKSISFTVPDSHPFVSRYQEFISQKEANKNN